ncbi:MAG: MFS transporter [Deinococcota bacterium]
MSRQPHSNIVAMGLVSLFTDFASSLVTPILPLFIVLVLDEGTDKVGYVVAIATFVSYILRFVSGVLSEHFAHNKPFLLIGYGISTVAKPLFAWSSSWASIAGIRVVERLGKAVRAAPKDSLISQSADKADTGKSFGLHKTLDVAGEMGGLIAALIILSTFGSSEAVFRNIFRWSLLPGVLALLILIFMVRDVTGGKLHKPVRISIEKPLLPSILGVAAFSLFMFSEAFWVLRVDAHGLGISGVLSLLVITKLTQVLLSYRVGVLLDRVHPQWLLCTGYIAGVLALGLLFWGYVATLLISFVIYGVHVVMMLNGIRTLIGREAEDKGSSFGFFYLIYALSSALGAISIGVLWSRFGVSVALSFSATGASVVLLSQTYRLFVLKSW